MNDAMAADFKFEFTPQVVNINGTSRSMLEEQKRKLLDSIWFVQEAMKEAAPNARDWQTARDPLSFTRAQREHERRAIVVHMLRAVVMRELEYVLDAADTTSNGDDCHE